METVEIKNIDWGDRARKNYGDLKKFGDSLKKFGLIQPIVLGENNLLLAGGRRTTAAILIGWTRIPFIRMSDLSPLKQKEVECEENLEREDLTWQEQVLLREQIHNLKVALAGSAGWSGKDTAEYLKISDPTMTVDLSLAKTAKEFPELLKEKDKKTAITKARRFREAKIRRLASADIPQLMNTYHGDAVVIMQEMEPDSIDLVLFDPPYGVNIHTGGKTPRGNWVNGWAKMYDDSTKNALVLMEELVAEISRVLKPGAHCYFFFALQLELETGAVGAIIDTYLNRQRTPLIWVKNTHSNKDPYKRFGVTYEPIYFCWKGSLPRDLIKAHHATFDIPVNAKEKQHPNEKPEELYRTLINLSTFPKEIVLDPTAGSGRALTAAIKLDRHPIGIEKDDDWFILMQENLRKAKEEIDA